MESKDYIKRKFKFALKVGVGFLLMGISLIAILYGYQILGIIAFISGLVIMIIGKYQYEVNLTPEEREERREEKRRRRTLKQDAKDIGQGFQEGINKAKKKERIRNYWTKIPPQTGI